MCSCVKLRVEGKKKKKYIYKYLFVFRLAFWCTALSRFLVVAVAVFFFLSFPSASTRKRRKRRRRCSPKVREGSHEERTKRWGEKKVKDLTRSSAQFSILRQVTQGKKEGKTRSVKSLHDRTCCRGQLSHTGQCSVSLSPS